MANKISSPQTSWSLGTSLLALVPFAALLIVFLDPPTWLTVLLLVVIVGLVGAGSTLMRRRDGAWRPSESGTRSEEDSP